MPRHATQCHSKYLQEMHLSLSPHPNVQPKHKISFCVLQYQLNNSSYDDITAIC